VILLISQDNQQYITVELFNSKMETLITQIQLGNERLRNELSSKINDVKSELHNEIQAVDTNVKINSAKIEMLGHYMYWGFAAMTLLITAVAFLVPYFLTARKDKKQNEKSTSRVLTEDNVRQLINEALQNMSASTIGK
jgi:hypothetical protein